MYFSYYVFRFVSYWSRDTTKGLLTVGEKKRKPAQEKISMDQFKLFLTYQSTQEELAALFDVSMVTLDSWCKENFMDEDGTPLGLKEVARRYKGKGKASLRRMQWHHARTSPAMAKHLGEVYLGQTPYELNSAQDDDTGGIVINVMTKSAKDKQESEVSDYDGDWSLEDEQKVELDEIEGSTSEMDDWDDWEE